MEFLLSSSLHYAVMKSCFSDLLFHSILTYREKISKSQITSLFSQCMAVPLSPWRWCAGSCLANHIPSNYAALAQMSSWLKAPTMVGLTTRSVIRTRPKWRTPGAIFPMRTRSCRSGKHLFSVELPVFFICSLFLCLSQVLNGMLCAMCNLESCHLDRAEKH